MFSETRYKDPRLLSKSSKILIMVATIAATTLAVNEMIITPAAAFMYEEYGDITSFILSGPSLLLVVSALLTGVLLRHFSKKTIIVAGAILFVVGGLGCRTLLDSVMLVCAMRCVIGFSVGMVITCCTAIIAEVFLEENVRGTMMGIWNAGMGVAGILLSVTASAFVQKSWQSCFDLYWVSIPILILLVLFIPRTAPDKYKVAEEDPRCEEGNNEPIPKSRFSWKAILLGNMAVFFVIMLVKCGFYFLNAVYIEDTGIGDASLAGLAGAFINAGSLIGCLVFGVIYARTKKFVVLEIFALLAIGYVLLAFVPSAATCLAASIILGLGNALGMSYFETYATVIVPPSQVSLAAGVANATLGVAQFLATYFAYFVMGLFPSGDMITYSFAATLIATVGIVSCIAFLMLKKAKR